MFFCSAGQCVCVCVRMRVFGREEGSAYSVVPTEHG